MKYLINYPSAIFIIRLFSLIRRIHLIHNMYNNICIFCHIEVRNIFSYIYINKQSIFITIDSLLNLMNFNINYCEYVVFIDEMHSLIKYLLICENLKNKRKPSFSYFMNILKSAKQIIMADGDVCNNNIRLLQILKRNDLSLSKMK